MVGVEKEPFFSWVELRRLLALLAPLYVGNLMQIGMGVIDTIVAGQAGTRELAAVALGVSVTAPITVAVGAVLTIIGPMISRLRGAGEERKVGLLLNNARVLACFLMGVELLALWGGSHIFSFVTEDAVLERTARHYLYFIMLSVPAGVMMRAFQGNFEGHGQTRPGMVVAALGLMLNLPLNYLFVFGWGPIPAMGGAGCGLATAIICWMMSLGLMTMMRLSFRHSLHLRQMFAARPVEKRLCLRIFRLGFPIGVASLCEMGFFCVVTLLIAPLGELMVGAQQIAINVSAVMFMLPFSLGVAVSIRTAYHVGSRNQRGFDAMVRTVLIFMYAMVSLLMLAMILLRYQIVGLYTDSVEMISVAQFLLVLCAIYQLSDSTQALMAGLLRGCHDTQVITWVNLLCYWLVGFPLSCVLIRTDFLTPAMGPAGAWVSFIISLTLAAILFSLRFRRTRRKLFPSPTES